MLAILTTCAFTASIGALWAVRGVRHSFEQLRSGQRRGSFCKAMQSVLVLPKHFWPRLLMFRPLQDQDDVWTKPQQGTSQHKHKAGETSCKMVASFPNGGCVILGHSKGLGGKLTHLSLGFFGANCLPSTCFTSTLPRKIIHVITVGVLVGLIKIEPPSSLAILAGPMEPT